MFGKLFCRLLHRDMVALNQRFPPERHEEYCAAVHHVLSIWFGDDQRLRREIQKDLYRWLCCLANRFLSRPDRKPHLDDIVHEVLTQLPEALLVAVEHINPAKHADLSVFLGLRMQLRVSTRARRGVRIAQTELLSRASDDDEQVEFPSPIDFGVDADTRRRVDQIVDRLPETTLKNPELARRILELVKTTTIDEAAKTLGITRQRIYRILETIRKWLEAHE